MTSASDTTFPERLRGWRQRRGYSQQGLAARADVSQRHVSFMETGRSSPSREMVTRLADALEVPLRDRDELLVAAGFAPAHGGRTLDAPELQQPLKGIRRLLDAHDPYPAFAIDGAWDVVAANEAAGRLMALFDDPARIGAAGNGNLLRLTLHPDGLWRHLLNRGQVRRALLSRMDAAIRARPNDQRLVRLRVDLAAGEAAEQQPPGPDEVALPLHVQTSRGTLSFYTALTALIGALDANLAELHLETLLPANERTAAVLAALRDSSADTEEATV